MAPSRRKGSSRPGPPTLARLDRISLDPPMTADSGTPIRSSSSHAKSRASSSCLRKASSKDKQQASSPVLQDHVSLPNNRPRPSIDDDNVEGDQDLTSPTGEPDLQGFSGSSSSSDDSDDLEDDDATPDGRIPNPLSRSLSTPLLVPAPPNAFAPPFYNRPPTPLPPSPSLTSLLRPSFSSRPTTPDDSESEHAASTLPGGSGSATEAAVAKSARDARTVPRASPKVPTYEYYGFVLYLTSGLCFVTYLLWSYLPSPFLHQLGIYYYPNRWWSLAVPAFLVMLLCYIYVALAAYNTEYLTPSLGSMANVVDDAANVAAVRVRGAGGASRSARDGSRSGRKGKRGGRRVAEFEDGGRFVVPRDEKIDWTAVWNEGTDACQDIPIGGVNFVLYGDG